MSRIKFSIVILVLFINSIYASDTASIVYSLGLKIHYGNILPHAKDLWEFGVYNPYGAQIDFGWYRDIEKSWEQCKCHSKIGLSLIWFNFGYPEVLGNSYNPIFYYEPLLSYKKKFYTSLKAGFGPSFLDNPYHEINNPENEFFSSWLSYILLLHLNFKYRITPQFEVNLSACYNHISNGGMKQPNRGINFPSFNIGFDYQFKTYDLSDRSSKDSKDYKKEKIRTDIAIYGTAKAINARDEYKEKILPVYGIYGSVSKRLSRMNAIVGGAEWVSDGYVKELMIRREENIDHHNASVIIGHELLIGKIIFSQNLCFYVYNPYESEDDVLYQRYSLRYQLTDHLFTGFTLKAHRHVAHIFDVRFGVCF